MRPCDRFKKNELRPHLKEYFVIPPEQNAEFVAQMEDILDLYQRPYVPRDHSFVWMNSRCN